jgi:hypothetical protein
MALLLPNCVFGHAPSRLAGQLGWVGCVHLAWFQMLLLPGLMAAGLVDRLWFPALYADQTSAAVLCSPSL